MIDKLPRDKCTGCSVCYDICPTNAIEMVIDREGFSYPIINEDACINCELCEKRCPVMRKDDIPNPEASSTPRCFAAQHKSYTVRFDSTSGGAFTALASVIYKRGGYVGGAIRSEDGGVEHFISNDPKDLARLRQSKYTQSRAAGFYQQVKKLLNQGYELLVCGTPCQMAGLRLFLKKDYVKLYFLDFICNNVNSPRLWEETKAYMERTHRSKLTYTKFKDKELGWRSRTSRYDFKNGKTLYESIERGNLYDQIYHSHVGARPACYTCPFKGYPRYADITLADYWGVEQYHPNLDDNTGTSAVICTTLKGEALLKQTEAVMHLESSKLEWIEEHNSSLLITTAPPQFDREVFFDSVEAGRDIALVLQESLASLSAAPKPASDKRQWKSTIKSFVNQVKRLKRLLSTGMRFARYRPGAVYQFIKYNFLSKNIKRSGNSLLLIAPYCVLQIDKSAQIILDGSLKLGGSKFVKSKQETVLSLGARATFHVQRDFILLSGSIIDVFNDALLEVNGGGSNVNCSIICAKHIRLGFDCMMGRDVTIRDTNAHIIAIEGYKVMAPVFIDDHVWLCSHCSISTGTHIGAGAVIGGDAVASGRIPAHSLVIGNPGKVVMKNIAWKY